MHYINSATCIKLIKTNENIVLQTFDCLVSNVQNQM